MEFSTLSFCHFIMQSHTIDLYSFIYLFTTKIIIGAYASSARRRRCSCYPFLY